jgi:hypothetical protein
MDSTPSPCLFPHLDSLRPPDWRWQTALSVHRLVRQRRRRMRKSDPLWLAPLVGLAEELSPSGGRRRQRTRLATPELIAAHRLYQADSPCRWELEARILAGQSDVEIAVSRAIPPAVVAVFEQSFFDVRDRLAAGDFILFGVVGYNPVAGFQEGDLRTLWAYFGYAAGPQFLELMMAVSQDRSLPTWAIDQAPCPAEVEDLVASIRLLLMASTGPLTLSRLRKLRVLHSQVAELAPRPGGNSCLTTSHVPGSTDCFGFGDVAVRAEAPAAAVSEVDSGESASPKREFAEVA